jgi:tRNA threonylcarbamoyladenosine biosynthesis protein TsaB
MHLLAIDTATNCGGVALSRNSEVIGVVMVKLPLRYSERILYYVDFLLAQHELALKDIDCFAVATGPGSFTGLRIGLSTVKAFSQVGETPVVGVSTLEALAYRFGWVGKPVAPVMDARRQQVFAAVYQREGLDTRLVEPERVARPEEWLRGLQRPDCVFVGDGAHLYGNTIRSIFPSALVARSDNQLLPALCRLAHLRYSQGLAIRGEALCANYVRPSDAELSKSAL